MLKTILIPNLFVRMHLDNPAKLSKCQRQDGFIHKEDDELSCVNQYGFHIPTCNGKFLQDNTWQADWWVSIVTANYDVLPRYGNSKVILQA